MNRTLLSLFFMASLMAMSQQLPAQQRLTEEERQQAMERYFAFQEELDLSPEQKPKVDEINKAYFEGLSMLRNQNATRLEKYRTFKELSSRRDQQMKEVLNKDQYKLYKAFQEETRDNIRERHRNNQR